MAFSVFTLLFWTGLDILTKSPAALADTVPMSSAVVSTLKSLRPITIATTSVVLLTVATGAFVAGNDAGHAYNDWPMMAGRFIPELLWQEEVLPPHPFACCVHASGVVLTLLV